MIIAAFAGTGKTTLARLYPKRVIDFVSMPYKYYLSEDNEDLSHSEAEASKANFDHVIREDWPFNYVEAIKKVLHDDKVLLIPSAGNVLSLLKKENIPYYLCYPVKEAKEEYKRRFIDRGNTIDFLSAFIDGWDRFIFALENDTYGTHIIMKPHQYLSDMIIDIGEISVAIEKQEVPGSPESDSDELKRVKAELAAIKQRFGLDKQEKFLNDHANITLKEFAAMLHGRDCQPGMTTDELLLAKQKGFVVVYGDSDDRVEFEGAIRAEGHTNPLVKDQPAGVLVLSEDGELLDEGSDLYVEHIMKNSNVINVFYCSKNGFNWAFESDIPHETFITYDGGYDEEYADFDDGFARCIVFEVSSLKD